MNERVFISANTKSRSGKYFLKEWHIYNLWLWLSRALHSVKICFDQFSKHTHTFLYLRNLNFLLKLLTDVYLQERFWWIRRKSWNLKGSWSLLRVISKVLESSNKNFHHGKWFKPDYTCSVTEENNIRKGNFLEIFQEFHSLRESPLIGCYSSLQITEIRVKRRYDFFPCLSPLSTLTSQEFPGANSLPQVDLGLVKESVSSEESKLRHVFTGWVNVFWKWSCVTWWSGLRRVNIFLKDTYFSKDSHNIRCIIVNSFITDKN